MKNRANMGYPGLCLWLLMLLSITSCATMARGNVTRNGVAQALEPATCTMEVLIGWNGVTPCTECLNLLSIKPARVKNLFCPGQPPLLILSFRLKNGDDVVLLKEQLYALGAVRQLTLSPVPRK